MTCDEMLPPICEIACVVVVLTLIEVKSSKDLIKTELSIEKTKEISQNS